MLKQYDLVVHLHRQREFSIKTFGPGPRLFGCIHHIRKELEEIEKNPTDLVEWIDVVLLAFDGAWRAGYSPEEIATCLVKKQIINEQRIWPDWSKISPDTPIEHVRGAE